MCGLLLVAWIATASCSGDTCSGGRNMSAPHLDGDIFTDADTPAVRISWSQGTGHGAGLPDTYFAQVSAGEYGDDTDLVGSVRFMAPRSVIVQLKPAFAERIKSKFAVTFTLEFPDRRSSIRCYHRGMSDRYILKVEMTFNGQGRLTSSDLKEYEFLGPI